MSPMDFFQDMQYCVSKFVFIEIISLSTKTNKLFFFFILKRNKLTIISTTDTFLIVVDHTCQYVIRKIFNLIFIDIIIQEEFF
jgi:hypothetical protein